MPKKQSPKTKHLLITNHVFSDKYIPHLALFWSQTFRQRPTNIFKSKPHQGRLSTPKHTT